jgi:pimeloyl-ACP methyl ester carboxylesterase
VRSGALAVCLLGTAWLLAGCATPIPRSGTLSGPTATALTPICRVRQAPPALQAEILAMNPERVTARQVKDLLAQMPAPQILSIHGGLLPIRRGMNSFAQFLIGMGYPEQSIRNPGNGSFTYAYYDSSDEIAGAVAWYYEHDGLRPMIVGHSQGGFQTIRVLNKLAGGSGDKLALWNPLTQTEESRYEIVDPLTGRLRPVQRVQVCYATVAVAGGLARVLPNQWDMNGKLRNVPDSVEDFTGFSKGLDPLGGDFFGYGPANDYRAIGNARVRNVRLPSTSSHSTLPYVEELLHQQTVVDWIQDYHPTDGSGVTSEMTAAPGGSSAKVLWAADVWYSIKKHWVLELQRLIRAQATDTHDG